MKSFIIILLMISLSSCRSVERALTCAAIDSYTIGVDEACHISIEFNTCYCYDFDFETHTAASDARRNPLSYCDGVMGYRTDKILADIRPKLTALGRLKEDSCNPKGK